MNYDHCELAPDQALDFLTPGSTVYQFPCLPEKAETILGKGLKWLELKVGKHCPIEQTLQIRVWKEYD